MVRTRSASRALWRWPNTSGRNGRRSIYQRESVGMSGGHQRPHAFVRLRTGMDPLTIFGAVAVTAMMLFYALERRSRIFVLLFAGACLAASAYAFLQGAWPFGVVELVWSGVALRRWWIR